MKYSRFFTFFCLASGLLVCSSAVAEPFKSGSTLLKNPVAQRKFDSLKLAAIRLESSYKRELKKEEERNKKNKSNSKNKRQRESGLKAELLSTYEDLAAYACSLNKPGAWDFSLVEEGHDKGDCARFAKRVVQLEPKSSLYGCLKKGKDSKQCATFFVSQQTMPYREASTMFGVTESSDKNNFQSTGNYRKQINQVESEIRKVKNKISNSKSQANKNSKTGGGTKKTPSAEHVHQLQVLEDKLVAYQCTAQPQVLYRTSESLGTTIEDFSSREDPEMREIRSLVKDYNKLRKEREELLKKKKAQSMDPFAALRAERDEKAKEKEQEEEPELMVRVRIISDSCLKQIERALKEDPLSKVALCARDGVFHPRCQNAKTRRAFKAAGKSNTGTSQSRNGDLSTTF